MRARHWLVGLQIAAIASCGTLPAWAERPLSNTYRAKEPARVSPAHDARPIDEEEDFEEDDVRLVSGEDDPPEFAGPAAPRAKAAEKQSDETSGRRKPALLPTDEPAATGKSAGKAGSTSSRRTMSSVLKKGDAAKPARKTVEDGSEEPAVEATAETGSRRPRPSAVSTGTPVTSGVLKGNRMAQLAVDVIGPQALTIGKPGQYVVRLTNSSDVVGQDVEVSVAMPRSVQLVSGEGTIGEVRQVEGEAGKQLLQWSIPEMKTKGMEQLTLTLTPKDATPVELGVDFHQRPTSVSTEIAIREPQLEVRIEGPGDLKYGDEKQFSLIVSNPGTGEAENVSVEVAAGPAAAQRVDLGTIAPGEQKKVPFQVAARAAGEMEIKAAAAGDGNLQSAAASRIVVHRAALEVAVSAPTYKYANSEVVYQVAIANNGDANADGVVMTVALPNGAKYNGGVDGATPSGNTLTWKVGALQPDTERVYQLRCLLQQTGDNRFEAAARAADDLSAAEQVVTRVEALADLKLTVVDPSGPTPVGADATYEVKIVNRGSKSAEKVRVLVQFAEGIEPESAAGGANEIADGQVVYDPAATLAPGKELVYRVKCKILGDGNHAYRVEVTSGDPESRLVTEGITRAYADAAAVAERPSARKGSGSPKSLR